MKNKQIKILLLCFNSLLFLINGLHSQVEIRPSSVCTSSTNFIDFKPSFRAVKGNYVSATISTEPVGCYNEATFSHVSSSSSTDEYINQEVEKTTINHARINNGNIGDKYDQLDNISGLTSNFLAYPNPLLDQLTIEANLEEAGPLQIAIYNIQGQLVKSIVNEKKTNTLNQLFQVDVADLDNGMYFIQMTSNDYMGSQKIIK